MPLERPVRWASDEEFFAVIARTLRQGDRQILGALRYHDQRADNMEGAYPSTRRIAAFTGLAPGYVRTRLGALISAGTIHAERRRGAISHYFIVPPVSSEGDNPPVSPRGDRLAKTCKRPVSVVSTKLVGTGTTTKAKARVRGTKTDPAPDSDSQPLYDSEGRPHPELVRMSSEMWGGRPGKVA